MVNEMIPDEKCEFRPHRMCHPVRKSRQRTLFKAPRGARALSLAGRMAQRLPKAGPGCVRAPVQRCKTVRANPKPRTKRMMRRMCREPESRADFALMRTLPRKS